MDRPPWGWEEAWTPSPCAEAELTAHPTDAPLRAERWAWGAGLADRVAGLITPVRAGELVFLLTA